MDSKVGQNLEEVPVHFAICGMIGEVIEWPESNHEGSLITQITLPPESEKFLASPHRQYTQEENKIIVGRAEVTRGYDDHLETTVLGAGDIGHRGRGSKRRTQGAGQLGDEADAGQG